MDAYCCCLLGSLHVPHQSFTAPKGRGLLRSLLPDLQIGFCLEPNESVERRQLRIEAFGPIKDRCPYASAASNATWR